MKLWIDDLRGAPEGYDLVAKNASEAFALYDEFFGQITHISFDHDLGEYDSDGNELTGATVLLYIEEQLFFSKTNASTLVGLQLHSSNSAVKNKMILGFENIRNKYNNNITIKYCPYESMTGYDGFGHKL